MMAQIKMIYIATGFVFTSLAHIITSTNRAFHNVINYAVSALFSASPAKNSIAMIVNTSLVFYATMRLQLQISLDRAPSTTIIIVGRNGHKFSFASPAKFRFIDIFIGWHSMSLIQSDDMNNYHTLANGKRGIAS